MAPPYQTEQLELSDGSIEYLIFGDELHPTLVLINGAGGPISAWDFLIQRLAGSFHIIAYNRPGIGRSSKSNRPQTVGFGASQLAELLDKLNIVGPVHLVGHSFGGLIANLLARQHPNRVSSVCFVEAATVDDLDASQNTEPGIVQNILDAIWKPDPNSERATAARSLNEMANAPSFPHLPVTVVTGRKSPPAFLAGENLLRIRAEGQRKLAALGHPGNQVFAEKSGHFPQFKEPDLVATVIKDTVTAAELRHMEGIA